MMSEVDGCTAIQIMDSPLRGTDLAVALALWSYADREGLCWPTGQALAHRAGLSRRGLLRPLGRLEAWGIVERVDGAEFGQRWVGYRLNLSNLEASENVVPSSENVVPTPLKNKATNEGGPDLALDELPSNARNSGNSKRKEKKDKKKENQLSLVTREPSNEGLTPRQGWEQILSVRKRHEPTARSLKYDLWSDKWKTFIKAAGSVEDAVLAYRAFWEHPDARWWRTNLSGSGALTVVLRAKHRHLFIEWGQDLGEASEGAEGPPRAPDGAAVWDAYQSAVSQGAISGGRLRATVASQVGLDDEGWARLVEVARSAGAMPDRIQRGSEWEVRKIRQAFIQAWQDRQG